MKKEIVILLITLISIPLIIAGYKLTEPRGYIIPWDKVELSYKGYNGEPAIDSVDFYEIVMNKNDSGRCRPVYTQYLNDKLETKVLANDKDALAEFTGRKLGNDALNKEISEREFFIYNTIVRPGNNVNLTIFKAMSNENAKETLSKYEDITPFAVYMKAVYLKYNFPENQNEYEELYTRLKKAGGYYFGMAAAVKYELETYGETDREVFCEAYYNGCNLYRLKKIYNISCTE